MFIVISLNILLRFNDPIEILFSILIEIWMCDGKSSYKSNLKCQFIGIKYFDYIQYSFTYNRSFANGKYFDSIQLNYIERGTMETRERMRRKGESWPCMRSDQ